MRNEFEKDIQELKGKIEEANSVKDNLDDIVARDYGMLYYWWPDLWDKTRGTPPPNYPWGKKPTSGNSAMKRSLDYLNNE